tara:strand:+ start:31207 stop:32961 length:1755 start_codon:yes stop_codon:yes gene_type:complete
MKLIFLFFCPIFLFTTSCKNENKTDDISKLNEKSVKELHSDAFQKIMDSARVQGSILIYNPEINTYYSNDFNWARTGRLPASTFKIPNSIIALETGIVQSDTTLLKWDGKPRAMKIWEEDLTLKQAFQRSCVPCYQEIARKIVKERMTDYLNKLDYGNMDVNASNIDQFWLQGASEINQFQQIDFLSRFYKSELPISEETHKVMKRIMHIESIEPFRISGKTGLSIRDGNNNGWFVGYFEYGTKYFFFATNIEPKENLDSNDFNKKRLSVTIDAYRYLELIPKKNLNYDKDYVERIVTSIANTYSDNYVFPEKGETIKNTLLKNLEDGLYNSAKSYDSLSAFLQRDMIDITNDKHISVSYNGNKVEEDAGGVGGNFFDQFKNYGFEKVEMLDDNIGYIDLTIFHPIQMKPEAATVAQDAMQSLKDAKAIIFDLRNCRGGDPAMLNLLATYLYSEGKKIHLNDFFYRPSNDTTSTYTVDKVRGRRFIKEPVVVLTGGRTFSAAEEFAYDLKHMGRATIIGETTGGGAHPVRGMNVENDFEVSVPVGRAINPITKTNWEGVGVIPDIKVKKEDALDKALEWINKNQ